MENFGKTFAAVGLALTFTIIPPTFASGAKKKKPSPSEDLPLPPEVPKKTDKCGEGFHLAKGRLRPDLPERAACMTDDFRTVEEFREDCHRRIKKGLNGGKSRFMIHKLGGDHWCCSAPSENDEVENK